MTRAISAGMCSPCTRIPIRRSCRGAIPTGKLVPVEGTPMDFRAPKKIGKEIDTDWDQLTMVGGYDHNWCLNGYDGSVRLVACTQNPSGSRTMEVCTDLPGVQFYAANGPDGPRRKGRSQIRPQRRPLSGDPVLSGYGERA